VPEEREAGAGSRLTARPGGWERLPGCKRVPSGVTGSRRPPACSPSLLEQVPIGKGLNGQTASAADAVRRLAAAAGHPLPKPIAAKSSASRDRMIIAGVVILLGTLALILVASVRRRLQ